MLVSRVFRACKRTGTTPSVMILGDGDLKDELGLVEIMKLES